ncbi:hypothetical protein [Zhihengliuella salsuginis]|uniref:Uncharacterized protein n=1 Tax=Zhihengliuella salsuginis TaxID=578222 RepID=A0ABQ3GI25_9MICC|nr:hypothetical protein [Zhihengliuella salsuginis]GHD07152.1 hypothetical protein GCM10008096_17620 [Zhihengliuella salsuginis]
MNHYATTRSASFRARVSVAALASVCFAAAAWLQAEAALNRWVTCDTNSTAFLDTMGWGNYNLCVMREDSALNYVLVTDTSRHVVTESMGLFGLGMLPLVAAIPLAAIASSWHANTPRRLMVVALSALMAAGAWAVAANALGLADGRPPLLGEHTFGFWQPFVGPQPASTLFSLGGWASLALVVVAFTRSFSWGCSWLAIGMFGFSAPVQFWAYLTTPAWNLHGASHDTPVYYEFSWVAAAGLAAVLVPLCTLAGHRIDACVARWWGGRPATTASTTP